MLRYFIISGIARRKNGRFLPKPQGRFTFPPEMIAPRCRSAATDLHSTKLTRANLVIAIVVSDEARFWRQNRNVALELQLHALPMMLPTAGSLGNFRSLMPC